MFCCAAIPFCIGGMILMVLLTSTLAPKISEYIGEWTLILIPFSALIGLVLGWMVLSWMFSSI